MVTATRKARVWKILAIVLVPIAAITGVTVVWVRSVETRRRAAMEQLVRQLHAETLARDGSRPSLHGDPIPGNAWTDYGPALTEVRKLNKSQREIIDNDYFAKLPNEDPSRIRSLIRDHANVFEHLGQGARRSSGDYPFDWERGLSQRSPDYYFGRILGQWAASRARILARDGQSREAVEGILDLFQFARDLGSNSTDSCSYASWELWKIAEVELKELVFSNEFPRQDLSSLEEALERLDRHLPPAAPIMLNETLCLGYDLLKPEGEYRAISDVSLREYWRYAFSRRIAEADAFERILAGIRKAAPSQDRSAKEFRAGLNASTLEPNRPPHPLIFNQWSGLFRSTHRIRFQRTTLRLLRVALHYRSTGDLLDLEDPFGDRLRHSLSGSDLKVWSVGNDGIDQDGENGGQDWSRSRPVPVPGRPPRPARDLVLEVER